MKSGTQLDGWPIPRCVTSACLMLASSASPSLLGAQTVADSGRPWWLSELVLDVESAGGAGISQALGLAGFTNLDVVRNPTLGSAPYVARNPGYNRDRGPVKVFAVRTHLDFPSSP